MSGSVLSGSNSPPPARTPGGARTRGMRLNVGAGSAVAEPPPWELHRYGSDLRPSVPTNWSPGPLGELIRQRGFRPSLLFLPGSPPPPPPPPRRRTRRTPPPPHTTTHALSLPKKKKKKKI